MVYLLPINRKGEIRYVGKTPRASISLPITIKMKTGNRNGVLGLDTAKAVMIAFLTLAVLGVSILLALTSLGNGVNSTIDTRTTTLSATNESGWLNSTGYTLDGYNSSWSGISISNIVNATAGNGTTITSSEYTLSSGVLTNATAVTYDSINVTYSYTYTYSLNRASSIIGNVSNGVTSFFASTGTIFSILIVVVIILAISIIIWAVGRFGQRAERGIVL